MSSLLVSPLLHKEVITCEIASKLLENVPDYQRKLRSATVHRYAKMMRDGDWVDFASMIVISREGELVDGQHRLAAQVEAGADVGYVVLPDVTKEFYKVIDSGVKRTISDRSGTTAAKASMAKALVMWENGATIKDCLYGATGAAARYASDTDVIRYIENNEELLTYLSSTYQSLKKRFPVLTTKVVAVFFVSASRLYGTFRVNHFIDALCDWNTDCPQARAAASALTGNVPRRDSKKMFAILARALQQYTAGYVPNMPTKSNFTNAMAEKYRNKTSEVTSDERDS